MKRFKVLSLAALVAFAACDEGEEPVVQPPITGTVSGVVTIEGTARSAVTVTLSSGATATTDGSGAYSFAGVNAGAYTVTISGFPTDATFSTTTKAATVTTAGQVVTVNFDGTYIRTSAILGSVTAGGKGLAGVKVSIGAQSQNTNADGQYAFSGLRAGSYTVTISGFDAGQYTFTSTTSTVAVGVGESKVASFVGQLLATAKISGTVTIDGTPAAGVTATLSTGATATTDAAGAYSFSNLTAGTYTVTISGYAADAQFESVAKPVVITSAGSTVTANFAGSYVKTSAISGSVSVAGTGIGGVTVTLSSGATTNTNASGVYSFASLRAGTYTVTISGWDAGMYSFTTTEGTATVATGEAAAVNFAGTHLATAKISGYLFIDEVATNGLRDTSEDMLKVAGVAVRREGGLVNDTATVLTDANGKFEFTGLVAGNYRVTILGVTGAPLNPALPSNVAFSSTASTISGIIPVTVGGSGTWDFPFRITHQTVKAYAFLGTDGVKPGIAPLKDVTLQLYDTYANATGATTTGQLGSVKTDAGGLSSFRFLRSADIGPSGGVDNIVYARLSAATLPANHIENGELVIEIKYNPKDSLTMAPDTFDALNGQVVFKVHAGEIDNDTLAGWDVQARYVPDSANAVFAGATTNAKGDAYFTVNRAAITALYPANASYPDTIWVRLAAALQPATHPFSQTPEANRGSAAGRYLRFIWDGTVAASDTVALGAERVKYSSADVVVRAHRERDDTVGKTGGDDFSVIDFIQAQAYRINTDGTKTSVSGPTAASLANGKVTLTNLDVTKSHEIRARSTDATLKIINDTVYSVTLDGSDEVVHDTLTKYFAVKANNNRFTGFVQARDGSPAANMKVRVMADAGNLGTTKDTTVVTDGSGWYKTNQSLLEGPYTITVSDSVTSTETVWAFSQTLKTTSVPLISGSANNADAYTAKRDMQGAGASLQANFLADRRDTKIQGVMINDWDANLVAETSDNEILVGAKLALSRDTSAALSGKWVLTGDTATSDGAGAYSFSGLMEGRYKVRYVAGTPAGTNVKVLRGLPLTDSVIVTTAATATGIGADNTRRVGTTTPATLPRWDYANSTGLNSDLTHFPFLYRNTTAKGTVKDGTTGIAGMQIELRQCNVSAGATSPPAAGACTSYVTPLVIQTVYSGAGGAFEFTNLTEGVYEIKPIPATVAGWGTAIPATALYLIVGNADTESRNFEIDP